MLMWIKRLFGGILLLVGTAIVYKVLITPQMVTPYPYSIEEIDVKNWKEAQDAHVLVVGDRQAKSLGHYREPLVELSSKGLKEPLKIIFWGKKHEGLHRTVEKLRFLAQKNALPEIIVYHGASEEFYEKRVQAADIQKTLNNFSLFRNERISSLLMLFPPLSRLIYWPVKRLDLGLPPEPSKRELPAEKKQHLIELHFQFYEHHLEDMMDLARERDRHLILTTTPVNYEVAPQKTCSNAQTPSIRKKLEEVKKTFREGKSKEAYSLARNIAQESLSHAHAHYWWGKAASDIGRHEEAEKAWTRGLAFDCEPNRISPIFNNILRSHSTERETLLVDFDRLVNKHLGRNVLFLNWLYPQHLFYQQFVKILAREIRHFYDID